MNASARQRTIVNGATLLWGQISGGGRFRRPLPERAEVGPTVAAVRAQQQGVLR